MGWPRFLHDVGFGDVIEYPWLVRSHLGVGEQQRAGTALLPDAQAWELETGIWARSGPRPYWCRSDEQGDEQEVDAIDRFKVSDNDPEAIIIAGEEASAVPDDFVFRPGPVFCPIGKHLHGFYPRRIVASCLGEMACRDCMADTSKATYYESELAERDERMRHRAQHGATALAIAAEEGVSERTAELTTEDERNLLRGWRNLWIRVMSARYSAEYIANELFGATISPSAVRKIQKAKPDEWEQGVLWAWKLTLHTMSPAQELTWVLEMNRRVFLDNFGLKPATKWSRS
jgi:hypothetical protein